MNGHSQLDFAYTNSLNDVSDIHETKAEVSLFTCMVVTVARYPDSVKSTTVPRTKIGVRGTS
jgi:hypothetical protein